MKKRPFKKTIRLLFLSLLGILALGFPFAGCLFVVLAIVSNIYQNTSFDTTPFTTAGFAFLATLTALAFNFVKTFDKEKNLKRYFDVQKGGVLFFLSTFFFLFTSVIRFSIFNLPLLKPTHPENIVELFKWISLVSIVVAVFFFIGGVINLLPHLTEMAFYDKERIEAMKTLYPHLNPVVEPEEEKISP
jgi:hypothetical protein